MAKLVGALAKMITSLSGRVSYHMPIGEDLLAVNELLGKPITITWQGAIFCSHCGRKTNKSFSQGYCYPCFRDLPQCDLCIMSPEKCHYHLGTCRDSAWGDQFCMTGHIVYLANSSGLKVGITRENQIPTRWIDQGATQAMPLIRVATRYQAGLLEKELKSSLKDKTNWRTMLKGEAESLNLSAIGENVLGQYHQELSDLQKRFGLQSIQPILNFQPQEIIYPVQKYPEKVVSISLDKIETIHGILLGIKGQYLILDSGVINIRKHTAYVVEVDT